MRWVLLVVVVLVALAARAGDDLQRAQELAWGKQFAEAEALYRRILAARPDWSEARLGLARVVMWQGRYEEALDLFVGLQGIEAIEGRATARYWSGDLRAAARGFREVLVIDPHRELARRSLAEIAFTAAPERRMTVAGSTDDQPLDAVRAEVTGTFYSDPQTRWTASLGSYTLDADRHEGGQYAMLANETTVRRITFGASLGLFTFPDGVRRPVGSASLRRGSLALVVDRRPEMASAPSLSQHVASTSTSLKWRRERNWIGEVELSHRQYSDHNSGRAVAAYVVAPIRRNQWTYWGGLSVAARDTDQSRFTLAGRYDPYWTPEDLREARAVLALERRIGGGSVKLHGNMGRARDRARAFDIPFDRTYRPWLAGLTVGFPLRGGLRIEGAIERSATIDYRVTSLYASLVRRH